MPRAGGPGRRARSVAIRTRARPAGAGAPGRRRRAGRTVTLGLVGLSWPVLAAHLRTPGWERDAGLLDQAADYLDDAETAGAAWVVPGSGFGIQTWGWTMEEPMQVLAGLPWVTRSQVPLTPAPTIRMLSALEASLETGAGSPYLGNMLERIGVDKVVVRHDLDPDVSLSTPSTLVALALARSPGSSGWRCSASSSSGRPSRSSRCRTPSADPWASQPPFDVRDVDDSGDRRELGRGRDRRRRRRAGGRRPADGGPRRHRVAQPVDIQGDQFRRRERAFGRAHQAESNVMAAGDQLPRWPGGAELPGLPVRNPSSLATGHRGGHGVELGRVRRHHRTGAAGAGAWSALDGDRQTFWRPAPFAAEDQWIESTSGPSDPAGGHARGAARCARPAAGRGLADRRRGRGAGGRGRPGHRRDRRRPRRHPRRPLRIEVDAVGDEDAPVGLAEVQIDGLSPSRTLVVPPTRWPTGPTTSSASVPESRACVTTLLGPDCDLSRQRASEEATGIDRTFVVPHTRIWKAFGLAVARSRPAPSSCCVRSRACR